MTQKQKMKNAVFFTLLVAACALGVFTGIQTFRCFKIAAGGMLGLATLCLVHFLFFPPRDFVSVSVDIKAEFPRDLKYVVAGFFLSMIGFLAGQSLLDAVLYYLNLMMNR